MVSQLSYMKFLVNRLHLLDFTNMTYLFYYKDDRKQKELETVSIAELLQNRQHAQNPNAVNSRDGGIEV